MATTTPFTDIPGQLAILRGRGMSADTKLASQWLSSVGDYRLSGYWYTYRGHHADGTPTDQFLPNTSLADVTMLYEFDRKLRTLIHDAIEHVEIGVRSHVSYHLGSSDPLAHENSVLFRPSFDHSRWIDVARRRIARARVHSEPIRHHLSRYSGSVPNWVLTEVLDFADISKLYEGMHSRDQWAIANRLGVTIDLSTLSKNQQQRAKKEHPLARWLEHLSIVRNSIAHHARVWNRSFTPAPTAALRTIPTLSSLPRGQSEQLYGALALLAHLLGGLAPGSTWNLTVHSLVEDEFEHIEGRTTSEMGFPSDWKHYDQWSMRCGD